MSTKEDPVRWNTDLNDLSIIKKSFRKEDVFVRAVRSVDKTDILDHMHRKQHGFLRNFPTRHFALMSA